MKIKTALFAILISIISICYLYYDLYLNSTTDFLAALISIIIISTLLFVVYYFLVKSIEKKSKEKYNIGDLVRYTHNNPIGEIVEDGDTYVIVKTKINKHLVTRIK
jgi:Na+/citrate or Na+/malate symporter